MRVKVYFALFCVALLVGIGGEIKKKLALPADPYFRGRDEMLFLREELVDFPDGSTHLTSQNIANVVKILERHGVYVEVLLIPTKVSILPEKLYVPWRYHIKQGRYNRFTTELNQLGVTTFNVKTTLEDIKTNSGVPIWAKRDTHWAPFAAYKVGQVVAKDLVSKGLTTSLPRSQTSYQEIIKSYHSDIYKAASPALRQGLLPTEEFLVPQVTLKGSGLLDDAVPEVVLCGTSYSVKPFPALDSGLIQGLDTDVLNLGIDSGGIWQSMRSLMSQQAYFGHPPKIVIWEFPERQYNLSAPTEGIDVLVRQLDDFLSGRATFSRRKPPRQAGAGPVTLGN